MSMTQTEAGYGALSDTDRSRVRVLSVIQTEAG